MHELLDAIRAGGDIDVIRKGVELVLQALIDVEAAEAVGAARYQLLVYNRMCSSAYGSTCRSMYSLTCRSARAGSTN